MHQLVLDFEKLFILDFFNQVEDIKTSFDPFYTSISLSRAADVHVLHELKGTLDDVGIYEWTEVESFVEKYSEGLDAQQLSPIIDVAANRFNQELELEDEEKKDSKIKAKQFVKIYGQLASIMLAFKRILDDVMGQQRKKELELYKLYAKDLFSAMIHEILLDQFYVKFTYRTRKTLI